MADNTTNFTLKLKTEGLENAQKGTKQIRDNLEGAQAAAQGIGTPGSASSRRFASSAAARPTGAAGVTAGIPTGGEVGEYNRARGAGGAAGGTARDFADQARGLGGLVRLYATVAANVFALTAAFSALSRAMDTTNMVKGLDQLGSASGIALGSLSKRLVAATDGAVSLREAMEATVKAASSGMKSDDILRLGKVAQQASLALGVNMQDALSRLTRGITKLEPELLDELGIFTKLDPAVKEYAKSVNKSVTELTDFERRTAFANAVLAEGEQKFNAIKIDSNPYTKLASAVQDASQKILEFVNKVLGPVAEFFSKSPTALITGISALAAILLKQAIPAIGEFRQGLERSAETARSLAQKKAADAIAARKLADKQISDSVEARADKELAAVERAEKKIQALQQGSLDKRSAAYKLLSKDLADIQEKDYQNVLKKATALESKGKPQEAAAYREVVAALQAQKQAEEDLAQTKLRLTAQFRKDLESRGTLGLVVRAGQKAEEAATKSSIISNAAYNGSLIGLKDSLRLLREEIDKNNIKGFDKGMLTLRGTLAIIGGQIATAMSALNGFFMAIGLVSAAIALLDGIFSKASKELADFSSAVDRTSSASDTLKNTLETIYKTNPFSVQSLQAQANAMAELSTSIEELVDKTKKVEKALQASWWDNLKDKFKDIFGFGTRDVFVETLAKSVSDAVSSLKTSPIRTEIEDQLKDLLKVKDVSNFKELEAALSKLDPKSETVKKLGELVKKAGVEAGVAAGKAKDFSDAFKLSEEAFRALQKQYENKTPLTEWTNAAINSLLKLSTLISGPVDQSISGLIKITEDVGKNPIFGSQSLSIAAFNKQLTESNKSLITNEASLKQLRDRLAEVEEIRKGGNIIKLEAVTGLTNKSRGELQAATDVIIKDLRDNIRNADAAAGRARATASDAALKINAAINKGLAEQVGIITTAMSAELAKGSNKVLENLYSRIDFMPEYVKKQQELKLKELESEANLIKVNQELANQSRLLAAELAVTNTRAGIETAQKEVEMAAPGQDKKLAAEGLQKATVDYSTAVKSLRLLKQAVNDPIGAMNALKEEFGSSDKAARSYAGSVLRAAQENLGFVKALQDNAQQQKIIKTIETPLAEEAAKLKAKQNALNVEKDALSVRKQQIELDIQMGRLGQVGILEANANLAIDQARLQQKSKSAELDSQTVQAAIIYTGLIQNAKTKQDKLNADAYINSKMSLIASERQAALDTESLAIAAANETKRKGIVNLEIEQLNLIQERNKSEKELQQDLLKYSDEVAKSSLDSAKQELEYLANTNKISAEYAANRIAEIAKQNQEILYQSQLRQATFERDAAVEAALFKASQEQRRTGDPEAGMGTYALEAARANEIFAARKTALDAANVSTTRSIELTRIQGVETAKQNEELKKQAELLNILQSISDTLSSAFGKTGAALGKFVDALTSSVKTQMEYNTERNRLIKIESDYQAKAMSGEEITPDDIAKRAKAEKDLGQLNAKNARDEMVNNTKLVGSVKNMFKEKTAAYKLFNAVERAMNVYTLTMDVAKAVSGWTLTTQKVAQAQVQAQAEAAPAAASATAQTPGPIWVKIAAGLAALAFVSSLASGGKGSAPSIPGTTAKDRQEVQGTGMEWRDGKKVETGRGVFGDSEAKSQSISNSLQRIKETNIEGITYASRTVKLLESIDRAIGGAAQELYGVQGLRAGTAFGTAEGTTSSGIQGLFGSKRSTEIIDAGIKFAGTFLDVMMGKVGSIMQYETTRTTKTSSGFLGIGGGTSTWESTLEKDLGQVNQTAAREVSKIFTNAGDLMIELGGQLGQTQEQVLSSLSKVDLTGRFASLRGLKGEELQKELSAVISSVLDDAATTAFKSLEKFRKFGEGMAETVIRVLDTNQKISDSFVAMGTSTLDAMVKQAFGSTQVTETVVKSVSLPMDMIGMAIEMGLRSISGATYSSMTGIVDIVTEEVIRPISEAELKQKSLEISEGLATLAGGLDKFLEKQKFFTDNFLTEAERLEPVRRALTDQLSQLGLGFVDTREEFKQVVLALGQNVTTEGGRELYNSVLDLAPAFNQVYEEVEDVKKALTSLELRNKLLDQELTILGLLGKEEEALAIKRQRELDELKKYPGIQGELLAANQEYIYALEDEKKAKDALIKRRQEVENTVKSLTSAIDALSKYKTTLLTGALTTLTPQQQYQENRTQFEQLQQKLASATTTEERTQLLSQLQGVSDKFLESSRGLFASSSAYASDFQSVMDTIDTYSAVLTAQKTDAEMQLEELTAHGITLTTIETNTKTTSELLSTYLTAQDISKQEDLQRQELRQQWEQSLLTAMTAAPEITLDIKPVVDELVAVKNELIKQQSQQAEQNTAAVSVSHADLQSILAELEKLRAAQQDMADSAQRETFAPVWEDTGA